MTVGESECIGRPGPAPYRTREWSRCFEEEILEDQSSSIESGSAHAPDPYLPPLEEKIHERYRDWFVDEPVSDFFGVQVIPG